VVLIALVLFFAYVVVLFGPALFRGFVLHDG
jgi:hypothetical protein